LIFKYNNNNYHYYCKIVSQTHKFIGRLFKPQIKQVGQFKL